MDTAFDILTGGGLALAAGIRPYLPALVAGAAASADLTIDFSGTDLSFLEGSGWLFAMVALLIVAVILQRRLTASRLEEGPMGAALAGIALGVGALLFAGTLADHSETWWPGLDRRRRVCAPRPGRGERPHAPHPRPPRRGGR